MRILPAALGLLLTSALPALAQTAPAAPLPLPGTARYYVGLAAYSSYCQPLGGQPLGTTGFRVPVQLTVGYQLRPRLAVQVGVAYSGSTSTNSNLGYEYLHTGTRPTYHYYENTRTMRRTSVSALARYTLTRKPAHRLQFDLLGGIGMEHGSAYSRGSHSDSLSGSLQTTNYSYRGSQNMLVLTLGASARYRLNPRFELNFDLTTNYAVADEIRTYVKPLQGFTGSAALGLRYRFGKQ